MRAGGSRCFVAIATAAGFLCLYAPVRAQASTASAPHLLYVEDGTRPDGIDVFAVSGRNLVHRQHVTVGTALSTWYGSHQLTTVRYTAGSESDSCLAFASMGDGQIDSFAVDGRGLLGSRPISTVTVGNVPGDMVTIGRTLIVSNPPYSEPGNLDVLTFGPGCHLRLEQMNPTGRETDPNIAVLGPSRVVSADLSGGRLVVYSLDDNGLLIETASQRSQLTDPDSVAVWWTTTPGGLVRNVYTGQAASSQAKAQGYQFRGGATPFLPLAGSPQTDGSANTHNGPSVLVDPAARLLVQANPDSAAISWYRISAGTPGQPGRVAFGGSTRLADPGAEPSSMVVAGSTLLVGSYNRATLQACAIAASGITGCGVVATLTSPGAARYGVSLSLS